MQAPERITTANAWRRDRMTSDASAPIAAARHAIKAGDLATAEALANQALVARPTDVDAIEIIALVAMSAAIMELRRRRCDPLLPSLLAGGGLMRT